MSYDIWLEIDAGGEEPVCIGDWNYTSNCSATWREAGAPLADWHGMRAADCIAPLADAIDLMIREPEKYRAMDTPNGWGTYDTLVPALQRLLELFRKAPKGIIRISR